MRNLLFSLIFISLPFISAQAQTALAGTVKDSDSGETLTGATVKISQSSQTVRAGVTNYDGEFRFQIPPGTYDIEVQYTGYQTFMTNGIIVLAGVLNRFDVALSQSAVLSEIAIVDYRAPIIKKDEVAGGQTLTSETIKCLPTRTIACENPSNLWLRRKP